MALKNSNSTGGFKIGINNLVSWGASVVIIGLMAKLQHWPWGDWMIVVGLGTEAILFFILGFQKEQEVEQEVALAPVNRNPGATASLDNLMQTADINPELIGRLGDGLRQFGDKVASINRVSDASIATTRFAETLTSATEGFHRLNASFEKATQELSTIGESNRDARTYQEQIGKLASNLEQLNSLYEEELRESDRKLRAITQHYENITQTLQHFNESAADTRQLKDQINALNKNLASLNAVYGNMLAAMNQPRV